VRERSRLTAANLIDALQHPSIGRILVATFLVTFAFVGMEATAALFGERRFGLTPSSLGVGFALLGVIIAVVQGGLIGRLVRRFGERAVAAAGGVVMGVSLLAIPPIHTLGVAAVVAGGLAVGQGLASPTLSTLLSRESDADEQGGTLGMGQSTSALARAVGPLIAGWLFDLGEGWPFYLGSVLCLVAAWQVRQHVELPRER
jgi:DHA1 family tetracycline resistance protein-like MFS transporter